jgi:hypothetical protein
MPHVMFNLIHFSNMGLLLCQKTAAYLFGIDAVPKAYAKSPPTLCQVGGTVMLHVFQQF